MVAEGAPLRGVATSEAACKVQTPESSTGSCKDADSVRWRNKLGIADSTLRDLLGHLLGLLLLLARQQNVGSRCRNLVCILLERAREVFDERQQLDFECLHVRSYLSSHRCCNLHSS